LKVSPNPQAINPVPTPTQASASGRYGFGLFSMNIYSHILENVGMLEFLGEFDEKLTVRREAVSNAPSLVLLI
jgi:hypothetical protein